MNLAFLTLMLPATGAVPNVPPPPPLAAAFTFVKVMPPPRAKVTWYPGTPKSVLAAQDMPVGLRAGYAYRFEITGLGDRGTETIYPSIEVRGSLIPKNGVNVSEHPVPIILSDEDITRILEGRFLSKIYYLEDPEKAINGPVLGVPVEISANDEVEALKEARINGRVMIVFRAGERLFTPEELATANVPGTILFPGARAFPVPAAPPMIAYGGIPLYDPLLGPGPTGCQECLFDGGDSKIPLGIGKGNRPYGLDPSDTAMEFTTARGRKITTSNRVCICVPRFAAMRSELAPSSQQVVNGPQYNHQLNPPLALMKRVPPGAVALFQQPIGATGQVRASAALSEIMPLTKDTLMGKFAAVSSIRGSQVHAQIRETEDITTFCDALILRKQVDPPHPKHIGEIVTFTLTYYNPTNQSMDDVVVSDSLTGRLEYIDGSAKSDRAATFTATPNEAGSLVLRWAVDGKLLPGQRGNITFKARIR